ncbi:MAG: S9 family peptidase, partial [Bradymonadaceae bacterium]|nr:S9 family peptidase [Lujinxingiaceae bacterium]
MFFSSCRSAPPPVAEASASSDAQFLWLEDVLGEQALTWVEAQNARSLSQLSAHPLFEPLQERALSILTSDQRLAYPRLMGERVTNFWRDAEHERGLWRMTSPEQYRTAQPGWEVLLDLDKLAAAENKNWVWAGASCRQPDYERCLVNLSIGGADAKVTREFDVASRSFVEGGFVL